MICLTNAGVASLIVNWYEGYLDGLPHEGRVTNNVGTGALAPGYYHSPSLDSKETFSMVCLMLSSE